MKRIVFAVLTTALIWSGRLEVTSDRFTHIDTEHRAIFEGHAHAQEGKSRIDAERFVVLFDPRGHAVEYRAEGKVRFDIVRSGQHFKGSCDRLVYRVTPDTYLLTGNVRVEDVKNRRRMAGARVLIDNRHKSAKAVGGGKEPVKFIFDIREKRQ